MSEIKIEGREDNIINFSEGDVVTTAEGEVAEVMSLEGEGEGEDVIVVAKILEGEHAGETIEKPADDFKLAA
jgi:hypothetical protein